MGSGVFMCASVRACVAEDGAVMFLMVKGGAPISDDRAIICSMIIDVGHRFPRLCDLCRRHSTHPQGLNHSGLRLKSLFVYIFVHIKQTRVIAEISSKRSQSHPIHLTSL